MPCMKSYVTKRVVGEDLAGIFISGWDSRALQRKYVQLLSKVECARPTYARRALSLASNWCTSALLRCEQ